MSLSKEDKNYLDGLIASFTAERPMIVSPTIYAILKSEGLVPDERIVLQKNISAFVNGYSHIRRRS